ncbi:hypothetical protein AAG570_005883 [Ranatra chinensis]|uniref:Uncharacterized protein n=1 Tax=Ranatra chinensis TaxID=642074 RepID=A0ABD0Y9D9_9HEMI
MASKRRNMFHKNKTQETTEEAILRRRPGTISVSRRGALHSSPKDTVWDIRVHQRNSCRSAHDPPPDHRVVDSRDFICVQNSAAEDGDRSKPVRTHELRARDDKRWLIAILGGAVWVEVHVTTVVNQLKVRDDTAKKGNIDRIQSFQSKVLRTILNAPWLRLGCSGFISRMEVTVGTVVVDTLWTAVTLLLGVGVMVHTISHDGKTRGEDEDAAEEGCPTERYLIQGLPETMEEHDRVDVVPEDQYINEHLPLRPAFSEVTEGESSSSKKCQDIHIVGRWIAKIRLRVQPPKMAFNHLGVWHNLGANLRNKLVGHSKARLTSGVALTFRRIRRHRQSESPSAALDVYSQLRGEGRLSTARLNPLYTTNPPQQSRRSINNLDLAPSYLPVYCILYIIARYGRYYCTPTAVRVIASSLMPILGVDELSSTILGVWIEFTHGITPALNGNEG